MSESSQLELVLDAGMPAYEVRRSRRARYLSVSITPQRGVTVTLPWRQSERAVEPFLAAHRDWVERELARVNRYAVARERGRLPDRISLPAVGRGVRVTYEAGAGDGVRVTGQGESVHVRGATRDTAAVCRGLSRWLSRLARAHLVPRLDALALEHGLPYTRVAVRGQRGRWGSASAAGHVNLNYKLMFLPPELVDYVLLHELTHTLYPDHSPAFWGHLRGLLPRCRSLDRQLHDAAVQVPWWAEH